MLAGVSTLMSQHVGLNYYRSFPNPLKIDRVRNGTRIKQTVGNFVPRCVCNVSIIETPSIEMMKYVEFLSFTQPYNVSEGLQRLTVADLNPETAKLAIGILGPFLSAFGFLFIIRIVMSWYPKLPVEKFPYVIAFAPTEPFLRLTRKVIPPLGGVDVTPVVWFGLVSFLNEILVGPQGLLLLLSQQV